MEYRLNIEGLFADEAELSSVIRKRRICFDTEPYYRSVKGAGLVQIGYQINLYGTFPEDDPDASPDDRNFGSVLRDVRKIALALSQTCEPLHMCETTITDSTEVSYSHERKMRPDVGVHVPVFDQANFGHPVDSRITETLHLAEKILGAAGVRKKRWTE